MKRWALLFAAVTLAPCAAGAGVSLTATATAGSKDYRGTDLGVVAESESGSFIEAGYGQYESNGTARAVKTYSGGAGFYGRGGSFGVSASVTPKVAGYGSVAAGFHGDAVVYRGGDDGVEVKLGAGVRRTRHSDDEQLSSAQAAVTAGAAPGGALPARRGADDAVSGDNDDGEATVARPEPILIRQNDLSAKATLRWRATGTSLSARATKSVYDRELAGNRLRRAQNTEVEGVSAALSGYPDVSTAFAASQDVWRGLWAGASYTNIKFKLGAGTADSYTLEAGVDGEALGVTAAVTAYDPSLGAKKTYWSLTLTWRPGASAP